MWKSKRGKKTTTLFFFFFFENIQEVQTNPKMVLEYPLLPAQGGGGEGEGEEEGEYKKNGSFPFS